MNPPPDKKRRTDGRSVGMTSGTDDSLWDDDELLLTQENIDTLMQSQVIGPACDENSCVGDKINVYKPTSNIRTVGRGTTKSRSSSDVVMCTYATGQETTYKPRQLAEYSTPLTGNTASISRSASSSIGPANDDITQLKADNEKLKKQLADLQMTTQGKIKILQDKFSQREAEIQKIKQEKVEQLNQVAVDYSNKEKCWQDKLEKLKSELQFIKHELNEEIQKHANRAPERVLPKPAPGRSSSKHNSDYNFSGDFVPLQKPSNPKITKDAMLQVSLSSDTVKPPAPVPQFKLNLKRSQGYVSGSYLVHKVMQLQPSLNQSCLKPVVVTPELTASTSKCDSETYQTSVETMPSSYITTDNSTLSSACLHLQESCNLLMRTVSCLHDAKPSLPPCRELLQSDLGSVSLLLPTIADSINTFTSVLTSLQFSVSSHSGSTSGTTDVSQSGDTVVSSESSLPQGCSARYIQILGHQVYMVLRVLKTLVTYSIPVCKILIQQVCADLQDQCQGDDTLENSCTEISKCCLLKKLCHLANHKLYDHLNSNRQICILALETLAITLQHCPVSHLERLLDYLPLSDVILACISEDVEEVTNRFRLGCGALCLVHTLTRSESVVSMMCTKAVDCIFYNVYSFCIQSLTDQPEHRYIKHEAKFVQILAAILTQARITGRILCSTDCHCGEVANQLLSVLHHIYLSGIYHESSRALALLHQGASIFQNLTCVDKDFVPSHENNAQYVEFVYGMDNIYKTLLEETEPVTQDLLLELRHDFYEDEEDVDESQTMNPQNDQPHPEMSATSRMLVTDADLHLPDPPSHSTPKQTATESRRRKTEESSNMAPFNERKKLKLSRFK